MTDSIAYWRERATIAEREMVLARTELAAAKKKFADLNREYGCELRDPNGTIWEHAAKVQEENAKLKADKEAMVSIIANSLDRFGDADFVERSGRLNYLIELPLTDSEYKQVMRYINPQPTKEVKP